MKPRATALIAPLMILLGVVACSRAPENPRDVVTRYFSTIGRDPMRTLLLLSPGYHESHGLEVAALEGWSWGQRWIDLPETIPNPNLAPLEAESDLDSAKLAWLMVQLERHFRRVAGQTRKVIINEVVVRNRARVATEILPPAGLRFVQEFTLSRADENSPWLIDSIVQDGVVKRESYVAFVMAPNEAMRQNIIQHLDRSDRAGDEEEAP